MQCWLYLGRSSNRAPVEIPPDRGRTFGRCSSGRCASSLRCCTHNRRHLRSSGRPARGECPGGFHRYMQSYRTNCGTCPGTVHDRFVAGTRWCLRSEWVVRYEFRSRSKGEREKLQMVFALSVQLSGIQSYKRNRETDKRTERHSQGYKYILQQIEYVDVGGILFSSLRVIIHFEIKR